MVKPCVVFKNLKIRDDVAMAFQQNAIDLGMDYSTYLNNLMRNDLMKTLLNSPTEVSSFASILQYLANKAKEPPMANGKPLRAFPQTQG